MLQTQQLSNHLDFCYAHVIIVLFF